MSQLSTSRDSRGNQRPQRLLKSRWLPHLIVESWEFSRPMTPGAQCWIICRTGLLCLAPATAWRIVCCLCRLKFSIHRVCLCSRLQWGSRRRWCIDSWAEMFCHTPYSQRQVTLHSRNQVRTSLMVQWLRIRLPMPGTSVRSLVQEDPTYLRASNPVYHNYWNQHA